MKQPKFKFGDKVTAEQGDPFTVNGIHRWINSEDGVEEETFAYNGWHGQVPVLEKQLILYQEPQEKKLYAYRDTIDGEVKFYEDDSTIDRDGAFKRSAKYDIEYPEGEK